MLKNQTIAVNRLTVCLKFKLPSAAVQYLANAGWWKLVLPGKSNLERHQLTIVVKQRAQPLNELAVNCRRRGKAAILEEVAVEGEMQQASDICPCGVLCLPI